ncbi:BPSL0761 family protein [Inhella proteolytica]|uniref:Uncharacterized protein n=1 Tax=Inhella proteolytica TaxID=2795029 RepID=A0A931J240_9BURK|nr:BPSL0761 family protein [Inhella proteolytica]MBH9578154.1 hypothetical protein [Inhella proteolytica]
MTIPHEYLRAIRGTRPLLEAVVADPAMPMHLRAWSATSLESYPSEDELAAELNANALGLEAERVNAWGDALMYARRVIDILVQNRVSPALRDQAVWAERHFPQTWQLPQRPRIEEPDRVWRVTFMGLI